MRVENNNKAFAYRVPIGDYNYLQCIQTKLYKGHSFSKQCLHDLQFMKKGSSSPNISKLARADISCQFMKTRSLCCRTVYTMNGL